MRLTKTEVLGAALLSENLVGTPPKEVDRANINSFNDPPRLSEALAMSDSQNSSSFLNFIAVLYFCVKGLGIF